MRDYKVKGQWGLEKDFHEYLEKMRQVSLELKRVLKNTGSCWINIGDSYGSHRSNEDDKMVADKQEQNPLQGYEKSLMLIPWEFAIQCRKDGWTVRNVIPWIKENAMPSSVKDRFTNKWEPIFFMTKARKYYFNLDAVREKTKGITKPFNVRIRDAKKGLGKAKMGDLPQAWKMTETEDENYNEKGERKQDVTLGVDSKPLAHYKGFNERWKNRKFKEGTQQGSMSDRIQDGRDEGIDHEVGLGDSIGKNPGDIFRINPRPFPEAHFATFPIDLPLKILKCACPKQVCKKCGKSKQAIYENQIPPLEFRTKTRTDGKFIGHPARINGVSHGSGQKTQNWINKHPPIFKGYNSCSCNVGFEAGIVLDPFFGAGTVGIAAEMLALNWKGIELSEEYVKIAKERLEPHNFSRLDDFFT